MSAKQMAKRSNMYSTRQPQPTTNMQRIKRLDTRLSNSLLCEMKQNLKTFSDKTQSRLVDNIKKRDATDLGEYVRRLTRSY